MWWQKLALLLALWLRAILCYPNGIGVDLACVNLVPQHGVSPQTTTPPYTITFVPGSYTPGQTVSVTISGNPNTFKGFMIQARLANGRTSELVGYFTAVANTRQACNLQALVHAESSSKDSLTFDWMPPSVSVGNVVFRATFVQAVSTFWSNVASSELVPYDPNSPPQNSSSCTYDDCSCSSSQCALAISCHRASYAATAAVVLVAAVLYHL